MFHNSTEVHNNTTAHKLISSELGKLEITININISAQRCKLQNSLILTDCVAP